MPSLRKRIRSGKRTTWDIRYYEDGKRKTYTIGETDRRTAEKAYHEFCQRLAEGIPVEPKAESSTAKLSDLASWAETFAQSNKHPKTRDREQQAFRTLIDGMGNLPLGELTPLRIEEYKARRLQAKSAHTVNIEIRVLNTALNQAVQMGQIEERSIRTYKQIRTPSPEPPEWMRQEQIELLLTHRDPAFRRFVQVALQTGCRRNEILGLDWSDVDLARRQIVIRGSVGKMGKRRTIPISASLHEVLVKWPGEHQGPLFPQFSPDVISRKFRRWVTKVGLPKGISVHSLRATFACQLIDRGCDIYTVSRLLGHSSVKVTEKHYLALDPVHMRDAVDMLDFEPKVAVKQLPDGDQSDIEPGPSAEKTGPY